MLAVGYYGAATLILTSYTLIPELISSDIIEYTSLSLLHSKTELSDLYNLSNSLNPYHKLMADSAHYSGTLPIFKGSVGLTNGCFRSILFNICVSLSCITLTSKIAAMTLYKILHMGPVLVIYLIFFSIILHIYLWTGSYNYALYTQKSWSQAWSKNFWGIEGNIICPDLKWEIWWWLGLPPIVIVNRANKVRLYFTEPICAFINKYLVFSFNHVNYQPDYNTGDIRFYKKFLKFLQDNNVNYQQAIFSNNWGLSSIFWQLYKEYIGSVYGRSKARYADDRLIFMGFVRRSKIVAWYSFTALTVILLPAFLAVLVEYIYANGEFFSVNTSVSVYTYYYDYVTFWRFIMPTIYVVNIIVLWYTLEGWRKNRFWAAVFTGALAALAISSLLFYLINNLGENMYIAEDSKKISKFNISMYLFAILYLNLYHLYTLNKPIPSDDDDGTQNMYRYNTLINMSIPHFLYYYYICYLDYNDYMEPIILMSFVIAYKASFLFSNYYHRIATNNHALTVAFSLFVFLHTFYQAPVLYFEWGSLDRLLVWDKPTLAEWVTIPECRTVYADNYWYLSLSLFTAISGTGYRTYTSEYHLWFQEYKRNLKWAVWFTRFSIDPLLYIIAFDFHQMFIPVNNFLITAFVPIFWVYLRAIYEAQSIRRISGLSNISTVFLLPTLVPIHTEKVQLFFLIHFLIIKLYTHFSWYLECQLRENDTDRTVLDFYTDPLILRLGSNKRIWNYIYGFVIATPFIFLFPLSLAMDVCYPNYVAHYTHLEYISNILMYLPIPFLYWINITAIYYILVTKYHLHSLLVQKHPINPTTAYLTTLLYFITSSLVSFAVVSSLVWYDTTGSTLWKNTYRGVMYPSPLRLNFLGTDQGRFTYSPLHFLGYFTQGTTHEYYGSVPTQYRWGLDLNQHYRAELKFWEYWKVDNSIPAHVFRYIMYPFFGQTYPLKLAYLSTLQQTMVWDYPIYDANIRSYYRDIHLMARFDINNEHEDPLSLIKRHLLLRKYGSTMINFHYFKL